MTNELPFSADYFSYQRLKTKEVKIGSIVIGGNFPIAVQSMTNTSTLDTKSTVEQCIRIINAGGELVRITAQGIAEAKNLKNIKAELIEKGYDTPIVADIHFQPKAAEIAAQYVDKVRINPGNYSENNRKSIYSDTEYRQALIKTEKKMKPLIEFCKKHQTAIRIGVNHGSLSNRILSKYGNTPLGMVESALEFVKIFEENDFFDLIISLKSSNVLTMVQANRMFAARMMQNPRIYPIHLGVTEAGNGLEGRLKSISGIAALLNDGIGDTLRISLTEAPEKEIEIALELKNLFGYQIEYEPFSEKTTWFNPFIYKRRNSKQILNIGSNKPAIVILDAFKRKGCKLPKPYSGIDSPSADWHYIGGEKPFFLPKEKFYIQDYSVWNNQHFNCYPLITIKDLLISNLTSEQIVFVKLNLDDLSSAKILAKLQKVPSAILVLSTEGQYSVIEWRKAFYLLFRAEINSPVILHQKFQTSLNDKLLLDSSISFPSLLLDGFGDGIWMQDSGGIHPETLQQLSFGILQSCRLRLTQTEYIACPSCGRTLFNIEKRLEEVRNKTKHLKHLKIAIMGCIVNGLGEMADADYGYVGSGKSKVNLYKGKQLMAKNIAEIKASEALVDLIVREGDWVIS